jgi:superfamily II DNA or RNA helicase
VELNPHQIEAASFALRNPLSSGVMLADEVGLGKTIEAGLVLCQYWAEKRRRLLVICPAGLRKQWSLELGDKFNLPNVVIDAKSRESIEQVNRVVVMSYNFASTRSDELRAIPFDLVVIDEAHKLRNVYKGGQMANNIKSALSGRRKILLSATPLQNSLMELFGLSSILSTEIFGDADSFKARYIQGPRDLEGLHQRLQPYCQRTLRKDVGEYILFTERLPLTFRFRSTDDEHKLYEAVSSYLTRDDALALPEQARSLIQITMWKLLASSSPAIAGTLERMQLRLRKHRDRLTQGDSGDGDLFEDENIGDEIDELLDRISSSDTAEVALKSEETDRDKLDAEIEELGRYAQWARGISVDTKSRKLIESLTAGFEMMREKQAAEKALVFTESRRTQQYLKNFLDANGYAGRVVLFNGSNSGPESREIIDRWIDSNREAGRVSGSRSVDARTALVEHFRDTATIMLATEAAAEGLNLQFCSLVVNYDLPWNPQRIEQRIGRCHRYGQKYHVVVINFLNERNHADVRVHELLDQKFQLFSGLFGTSDEILGAVESGIDFEKRILEIYRRCKTREEIDAAFQQLQADLAPQIEKGIQAARQTLLDRFDPDVHDKLKVREENTKETLDRISRLFWSLTRYMLRDQATFDDARLTFYMHAPPENALLAGRYELISKSKDNVVGEFLYRMSHPLGEWVLNAGKTTPTPTSRVCFDLSRHRLRNALVERVKGQSGWLTLQLLVIDSFDTDELLLFSGVTDTGRSMDQETCEKLFLCDGEVVALETVPASIAPRLEQESKQHLDAAITGLLDANNKLFQEECERIEKWAKDIEEAAELRLNDVKKQIDVVRRRIRVATTIDEQLACQNEMSDLETQKKRQRREIEAIEDSTVDKRESLIQRLKKRMTHRQTTSTLFTLRWEVV